MGQRKEFQLTKDQKEELLKAMQPVPYLIVGGMAPRSQQENANDAWAKLGAQMGFKHMTVKPSHRGDLFFTAEASEGELRNV